MGMVDSLCDSDPITQTYAWCTFECIDNYTVIVETSYAATLLVIAALVLINFRKLIVKLHDQDIRQMFGSQYLTVYKIVLLWLACSIVKVTINLSVYWKYMSIDFQDQPGQQQQQLNSAKTTSNLAVLSALFNVFDFMCIFCVLLLILLIPHKWISNTLGLIHEPQLALASASSSPQLNIRVSLKNYFRVLAIVRIYYKYVRLLFLPLLFVQPFLLLFVQSTVSCQLPTFNYLLAIGQSILILLFYAFCFRVVRFLKKNQLIRISKKDFKMLSIEYGLLLCALILRIILNFYFRISPFYQYQPTSTCSDPILGNKIKATIFLSLAHYVMHALAIVIIVRIYRPDMSEEQRTRGQVSLIDSGESQSTMKTGTLSGRSRKLF